MSTYFLSDALEVERNTYNVAFCEFGLTWYWDSKTFADLRAASEKKYHVQCYLETHHPHLLRAYDAEFLVNAIEARRARSSRALAS